MITPSADYKTAALANYRDPRARVKVTWFDSMADAVLSASVNDDNRVSYVDQTHDGVIVSTRKWAYCSTGLGTGECVADGSFYPMPALETGGQVGWFNAVASDSNGEWVTDPMITVTFANRAYTGGIINIQSDTGYNEYPADFTIRLYDGVTLKHTQVFTGNTDVAAQAALTGVSEPVINKVTIEINRWGTAYGIVKIIEIGFNVSDVYYGDEIASLTILEEMEVDEGSLPIGNISSNEITLQLSNEDGRFSYGNTNSAYNGLLKRDRKIEVWVGFALPSGSSDVSSGTYLVETIGGVKIGFLPYGVYWSDDWISSAQTLKVQTFARDRMDWLRRLTYDDSSVYADASLSDLVDNLMNSLNAKVRDTVTWQTDSSLDDITVPYGYFEKKSYFDALRDIVIAGVTTAFVDRAGKIIVGTFPSAPGSSPSEATWDHSTILNSIIEPKTEEITNYIEVKSQTMDADVSTSKISSSGDLYTIPAGETTLDVVLKWDNVPVDPATVVTTLVNDTGTSTITSEQYYAWGGYLTVTGIAGNKFSLSSIGTVILVQSETVFVAQDEDSVAEYGRRMYELPDNHLIQSYDMAKQIGDNLLPSFKDIRKDASVSLFANTIVELADPILLTEYKDAVLETTTYFYIVRQELTYDGSLTSTVELRRIV